MSVTRRFQFLRGMIYANLALLLIVYILGMAANLYVSIPGNLPGGNASQWAAANSPLIQAHLMIGTLIWVIGIVAIALSVLARHTWGIITTSAGFLLASAAYIGGTLFLNNGQQNSSSMLMAIGFLGSMAAYGLGAYFTRR